MSRNTKVLPLLILLFVVQLHALESQKLTLLERLAQPKLTVQSDYLHSAAVASTKASLKTYRQKIQINNAFAGFSYSHWRFDWDDAPSLPFGSGSEQPISDIHQVKLDGRVAKRFNDKWFFLATLSVTSTFEKEMEDSYGLGLFGLASYALDDDHAFQIGAFGNYHPTKTLVLPAIGYSYRARQRDGVSVILGFPRTYVGYHLDERTLFKAGMVFTQAVTRLADESPIEQAGFIETKDYMSNIGLQYDITDTLKIDADLLYALKRTFTIFGSNGNETESYDIDPSFGALLKLKLTL